MADRGNRARGPVPRADFREDTVAFARYLDARPDRSRANASAGVELADVMRNGSFGEDNASAHPIWKIGERAESMAVGWQTNV